MNRSTTTAHETTKIGAKPAFQVAVRTLVAFVLRCGDLRTDYMGAASAVEGIRAHQRIQRRRPAGYEAEVSVRHIVTRPEFDLCVSGRIDGVLRQSDPPVVEEIKTTRRPLDEVAAAPSPVHWGQALCYAYLWGLQEGVAALDVRLTYVHADSGRDCELLRHLSMEALTDFFDDLIGRYLPWIERLAQWLDTRDRSVTRLAFPYAAYRPGQREMAVAVFRAIRDGGHLMVQAATGIGKTMAALYPAIKALGERHTAKVAFLTARTTGRMAAQDALQTLAQAGLRLKWVVLTAKEKICFSPGLGCGPETCPFAKGHFDRLNDALAAALYRDALTREAIEQVSREYQVCPFELSLELLDWCDGMVGDYNYAFDPHVTLRRLFGDEGVRPAVLVDEAHNLVDRARDMFSAQLDKTAVLDLRRELKQGAPMLYRALGPVNAWMNERRGDCQTAGGTCIDPDAPALLVERLKVFMAAADRWLRRNVQAPFRDALLGFFFECHRFVRIAEQYSPAYTTISQASGKAFRIKLFCMDPSGPLNSCWQRCGGAVLFSATLTPADYFRSTLGLKEDTIKRNLVSPFPQNNLAVFVTPRISTLYQQREASCRSVTRAIAAMVLSNTGNYLLFFPSYDYLSMVHQQFCRDYPGVETLVQTTGMAEADREAFLSRFNDQPAFTLAGFAVMGGIFGEGIDLKGRRLSGAAIVGVGLPGIGTERELIREYYDRTRGSGFAFAYQFPGINRVLQAAGRVIRSETDRGVVLLVDQRFLTRTYRSLLPATWQMCRVVDDTALVGALTAFWQGASDWPNLTIAPIR